MKQSSLLSPGTTTSVRSALAAAQRPFEPSHAKSKILAAAAALVVAATGVSATTVAITEFMIDPWGTDLEQEWVEFFNYGADTVDLSGWTLKDNASAFYTFPTGASIPSGGYVIVAQNGVAFTNRWLGGVADERVFSTIVTADPADDGVFQLNNSTPGDGLYLLNAEATTIWTVGFTVGTGNGVSPYRATWLTIDDFTVTNYGIPPQQGDALINRNGLDGTGTLGYEDNNNTADPFAYASAAGNEENPTPEWGSPLAGGYTAVPEPASLGLLAIGSLAMLRRRRA